MPLQGIKYISALPPSGLAIAAQRNILALIQQGIPVTWSPVGFNEQLKLDFLGRLENQEAYRDLFPYLHLPIAYDVVIVHTSPEFYPVVRAREPGKKIIGYSVWETDQIPEGWLPGCQVIDQLWVPCEWNQRVFAARHLPCPIEVIPHIAEDPATPWADFSLGGIRKQDFVFYTIGVWSYRKGIDLTIKAFLRAFSKSDQAVLIVKTCERNLSLSVAGRHFMRSRVSVQLMQKLYGSSSPIFLIDQELSHAEIRGLHQRGDCFVSLTRGEGWGLGAFDAAAIGNPVIMTGHGGQTDYLHRELAYLVDFQLQVARATGFERDIFPPPHQLAVPDLTHAVRVMRRVYEHKQEAQTKARRLQTDIQQRFNAQVIGQKMVSALERDKVTR
ncbi:MAG TPA: glycosyltransferase family 4 protein [Acidobacteriota bacterium]|nr:glycosyltransferase family 4 protein [Acidobacteriota bacterium]